MSNAAATGRNRRIEHDKQKRQALLDGQDPSKQAIPGTPPQDPESQPPVEKPAGEQPTQEKPTEGRQDPVLKTQSVDYKSQFERERELRKKAEDRAKSIDGRLKAQSRELQELKRKLEHGEGTPDIVSRVKESDEYKQFAEEYGQEMADHIMGIAKHFANSAQSEAVDDDPDPEPLGEISDYDEFIVSLNEQVPGWDAKYNRNPQFEEWAANTIEPVSGQSYLDLLNHAANVTFNTDTAKRIFSAFDAQVSSKSGAPSPHDYVEPRGSGGDGSAQPEAPTFKEGDLKHMERLVRMGKKTRKEFEDFKRDFLKARQEGRVTA
ncbi:MAG TPA: hypothetical protein VK973_03330 [Arenicellales bacterium]|nr:hypothetical protein [Arenicellales bacterium]